MWLSVILSTVNIMELGSHEWRDSLFLRYNISPPDLSYHCNGCGAAFSIYHALDCKKGGLIMEHHNELHDGVADHAGKNFTPMHVPDDPIFFTACDVCGEKAKAKGKGAPPKDEEDLKGYLPF